VTVINVCVGLVLAAIVFLAVYLSRRQTKRRVPAIGAQRMCNHCGRITARSRPACLECGKALTT
jgi:uncharacterized OB-fold protein